MMDTYAQRSTEINKAPVLTQEPEALLYMNITVYRYV